MRFIFLVVAIFVHQVLCQLPITKRDLLTNIGSFRQPKLVSTIATISPTTIIYNNKQTNDGVEITTTNQYTVVTINKTKNPTVTEADYTSTPTIKKSTIKGFSKLAGLTTMATTPVNTNLLPLPPGAGAVLVKPTKYHYYPHNQHIYLLPECAIQQVCNAVYVRLNWTQPLCACPSRYRDPCSASLNSDDLHTTKLITGNTPERALTLVKTCEPTADMRLCRTPRDWSLLALQNIRTGKSHYLVICHCPESNILEGPMSHDQPTYASVPGIRVYGMMCVNGRRRSRPLRVEKSLLEAEMPVFPWHKVAELVQSVKWD